MSKNSGALLIPERDWPLEPAGEFLEIQIPKQCPKSPPSLNLLNQTLGENPRNHIFKELPDHHETSRPAPVQEPLLRNFKGGRISLPKEMVKEVFVGETGSRRVLRNTAGQCVTRETVQVGWPAWAKQWWEGHAGEGQGQAMWQPSVGSGYEMGKPVGDWALPGVCKSFKGRYCVRG